MTAPQELIPFARPDFDEEEIEAAVATIRSGWITTGPAVARFEDGFGSRVGATHAVATNSCTAAMHLALEAMGVGEGDEVIVPPYTFTSTAAVIEHLCARPVFVDVEPETFNIDPNRIEAALTQNTKAILPVHFAGHPAEIGAIYELAAAKDLCVVEDCAHAFPASFRGKPIGADLEGPAREGIRAHAACFSFYATKTLSTGEGGMLCTDSGSVADRARIMALHGMTRDAWKRYTESGSWYYEVTAPGFKYNMPDLAACLGIVQLAKAEIMWERRRMIAEAYTRAFRDLPELETPSQRAGTEHSWHIYALRLNLGRLRIDRAGFIEELRARGVCASVHFIPLHIQPFYAGRYGYSPEDFPVALREYRREVSLPIYSGMTTGQVDRVIQAVAEVASESRRD